MACGIPGRNTNWRCVRRIDFSSQSERLSVSLPVEKMMAHLRSERLVEADALQAVGDIVRQYGLGPSLLLVCDDTTWVAAGRALQELLQNGFQCTAHSLGRAPEASLTHIEGILQAAQNCRATALIAVGSGTINDLTKYAAHQLGYRYLCVATAASMNGYSSATASLLDGVVKHSYVCTPPLAVIADLRVIAASPRRLARAGVGDTLCRSTVAADRYISHVVLGTPFEHDIFEQLRAHEQWLMQNMALLREGSIEYMRHLMHALLDAGDAMTLMQSSVVASQGEHMIAHTLEMMYGRELRESLHGEMIAVTTTTMAHLQHKMLLGQPGLRHHAREADHFARLFGRSAGAELAERYVAKVIPEAEADARDQQFQKHWPDIKAELLGMIVPANGVERAFKEAGLATTPQGIGLMAERYASAQAYAYMTRDRFTFLDLAAMNARRA